MAIISAGKHSELEDKIVKLRLELGNANLQTQRINNAMVQLQDMYKRLAEDYERDAKLRVIND